MNYLCKVVFLTVTCIYEKTNENKRKASSHGHSAGSSTGSRSFWGSDSGRLRRPGRQAGSAGRARGKLSREPVTMVCKGKRQLARETHAWRLQMLAN